MPRRAGSGPVHSSYGSVGNLSRFVTYIFDVQGWMDWEGDRHGMPAPDDPSQIAGMMVHIWDDENPDDQETFWTYTLPDDDGTGGQFTTWEDWYDYITSESGRHGMALAE